MSPAADIAESTPRQRIHRLLVALDASPESLAVIEAVTDLAARMRADILGLFVEDADLLGLAGHPWVRGVSPRSGRPRPFDTPSVERALRRQTEAARAALEAAATRRRVRAEFSVKRGRVAVEAMNSADEADLIVICRTASGISVLPPAAGGAGTAARELIDDARHPVFILDVRAGVTSRVFAAFDGSEGGRRTLRAAARIADRRGGEEITVLVLAADEEAADALGREAADQLTAAGHSAIIARLKGTGLEDLCAIVSREGAGVLVLAGELPLLAGAAAHQLLERVSCSILLIR